MKRQYPTALLVAARVLRALTALNVLYGTGILLLLIASMVAPNPVFMGLLGKPAEGAAVGGMRLLMLFGFAAVPVTHMLLVRLRAMVATVVDGDPFVLDNARRLNQIAFAVLALELLHLAIGAIVKSDAFVALGVHIDWSASLTPWLAVLLLFVLALVFEHGARMRADLEGTV